MKIINKKTLTAFLPAIILLAFWTAGTFVVGQQVPAPKAAAAFDHSNCQYPDRWSNPADGCDNSDPAVPECIKGMSTQQEEAACIDAFVAEHSDKDQSNLPDPDRDYYDGAGNLYDYQGNLKQAAPKGAVAPSSCTGK